AWPGPPPPEAIHPARGVDPPRAAPAPPPAGAARRAGVGPASPWNDRARLHRPAVRPGVNAWRTSGWAG
ncbi:RNA polymerase sigma factor SigF, partial [Kitasatospora sp. NPDC059722]